MGSRRATPRRVARVVAATSMIALLGACTSNQQRSATTTTALANTTADAQTLPSTTPALGPDSSGSTSTTIGNAGAAAESIDPSVLGPSFSTRTAPRSSDDADATMREQCPNIARVRTRHPAQDRVRAVIAAADSLPSITDDVTVFADENGAAATFNALASNAMLRCLPKLVNEGGLVLGDVTTARVPVDESGDAAAAIRLSGTSLTGGLASQVTVELIVVVRGTRLHVMVATASDLFPLTARQRSALVEAAGA